MSSRIIAIVGATGNQGGSTVEAILANPHLSSTITKIRCLTRNPKSEKAKSLAAKSPLIELVQAEQADPESLRRAFDGAWAVFGVTNFWEPGVGEKEEAFGKNLVKAAQAAKVGLFIWSSLEDGRDRSGGKYEVIHFTGKAKVDAVLKASGIPYVVVQLGFYISNFRDFHLIQKDPTKEGHYTVSLPLHPTTKVPFVDPLDTGHIVAGILQQPSTYLGKVIPIYSEMKTIPEALKDISQAMGAGKTITFNEIKDDKEGEKIVGFEFTEMCRYFDNYGYFPSSSSNASALSIYPRLKTVKEWVRTCHYTLK